MANEYDDLNAAAVIALGEVLNLAAQVAEMQMDEQAREDIYELLDEVADYYGVERREIKISADDEDGMIVRYTLDDEDVEKTIVQKVAARPTYISLAVDNDKKPE